MYLDPLSKSFAAFTRCTSVHTEKQQVLRCCQRVTALRILTVLDFASTRHTVTLYSAPRLYYWLWKFGAVSYV